jgi:hypothetical protein
MKAGVEFDAVLNARSEQKKELKRVDFMLLRGFDLWIELMKIAGTNH